MIVLNIWPGTICWIAVNTDCIPKKTLMKQLLFLRIRVKIRTNFLTMFTMTILLLLLMKGCYSSSVWTFPAGASENINCSLRWLVFVSSMKELITGALSLEALFSRDVVGGRCAGNGSLCPIGCNGRPAIHNSHHGDRRNWHFVSDSSS